MWFPQFFHHWRLFWEQCSWTEVEFQFPYSPLHSPIQNYHFISLAPTLTLNLFRCLINSGNKRFFLGFLQGESFLLKSPKLWKGERLYAQPATCRLFQKGETFLEMWALGTITFSCTFPLQLTNHYCSLMFPNSGSLASQWALIRGTGRSAEDALWCV